MSLSVRVTPAVQFQIRSIDEWWRLNRTSAPDLFAEELSSACKTIADAPQIGRPYRASPVSGTRRLLLKRTRYHIYYVVHANELFVLAVWHAQRGVGPPLRIP